MSKLNTFLSRIMSIDAIQRQSIISFIWKIAITFLGFLSTMYFAHNVGAPVLGAYYLFLAYYGIINLLSDGGFGGAAIKRISEGEDMDAYFSAFIVLRSFFVIMVIVALLVFQNHFVDLKNAGLFNWLLIALIASLAYGAMNNAIAGRGKIGVQSTCGFISEIVKNLVQVIAVVLSYGVAGLAGGFVVGMIVASLIEFHFFDLKFQKFRWFHVKSLSIFSFWLFLTASGIMVYSYADTVMIGYYMSNADVGVYRVVLQFTSIAALVTSSLQATLWPKVSRWGKIGDIRQIQASLCRAIHYSLTLAFPICIGGIMLGDKLLYYFYGADFAKGYPTLVVLLVAQIVTIFQSFYLTYLGALDLQKEAFKVTSISAVANIVLNAVLIPIIGTTGAAVATLVTIFVNAILAQLILLRIVNVVFKDSDLLNILKASFMMLLFVGGYRMFVPLSNVWLALIPVVLGAIVYAFFTLKYNKNIYKDLKDIMVQMNVI